MNTLQLFEKINNDAILKEIFIGVSASDTIPMIKSKPAALIINLDVSKNPGSHWVALFYSKDGKIENFDSFGRQPIPSILDYISNYVGSYTYNNVCVQELWTISCGQMCLYYLVWRCRGIPFREIINSMVSDDFIAGFIDSL